MFDTFSQLAAEWILPALFFWLVLSLFATNIQEWMAETMNSRAKALESAMRHMLGNTELTRKFYLHPLMETVLLKISYKEPLWLPLWLRKLPLTRGFFVPRRILPDYLSPRLFSQVMVDWIVKADESTLSKRKATTKLLLRKNIQTMRVKYPQIGEVLEVLLSSCGQDDTKPNEVLFTLQANLEGWFNAVMEETSRRYKRHVQRMLLIIGFMVALLTNFDPISMTAQLWESSQSQGTSQASGDTNSSSQLPIGWKPTWKNNSPGLDQNCQLFPRSNETFGIPYSSDLCLSPISHTDRSNIITKLAGIIIGSILISVGSQYIFDLWKSKIKT